MLFFLTLFWCTVHLFRSAGQRAGQRGGNSVCRAGQGAKNLKKIGLQHAPKKYFLRVFSEKIFSRVYIVSVTLSKKEKKFAPKNFLKKGVDKGVHPRYNGDTPRGYTPRPPDSVEGRADSPNGVHLVRSHSPCGQHSADRRRV